MVSVLSVNSLSFYNHYLNCRFFSIPSWFLSSSPLHWFLIGFCPCPVRLSTDVICLPIHPGFSLNVFPDAFRSWPRQTVDSSSQCFSLWVEVTVLCKTPFAGTQRPRRASLSALLTPTPQEASGFVWGLVHPYSTPCTPHISVLPVICAWNCHSAQLEILSRILLIAVWKVLHHPLLTTFCIFHIQNRLVWWVLLFLCLVLISFPISAHKKKILLLGLIFL